jgi:hypothetical protein
MCAGPFLRLQEDQMGLKPIPFSLKKLNHVFFIIKLKSTGFILFFSLKTGDF